MISLSARHAAKKKQGVNSQKRKEKRKNRGCRRPAGPDTKRAFQKPIFAECVHLGPIPYRVHLDAAQLSPFTTLPPPSRFQSKQTISPLLEFESRRPASPPRRRSPPPMDPAAPGRFHTLQEAFKSSSHCILTSCSREVNHLVLVPTVPFLLSKNSGSWTGIVRFFFPDTTHGALAD